MSKRSNYSQQCQEYVGYLGIQRTKKGEYIVRDPTDRELSRHETLRSARKAAKAIIAEQQRRQEAAERRWQSDKAFQRQHPDLLQRQIAWQEARSEVYQALTDLWHELALLRRERAVRGASWKIDGEESRLREHSRKLASLYLGAMTELDTQLKEAWRAHDAKKIASLLSRADTLLRRANELSW